MKRQRLSPQRIGIAGFGSTRPTAEGETDEARAVNRRVDIVILSPAAAVLESTTGTRENTLADLLNQLEPVDNVPKPGE